MSLRRALKNLSPDVSFSNAFIFKYLHTLACPEPKRGARHGALATPLLSITSALFGAQRRGGGAKVSFSGLQEATDREPISSLECALTSQHRVLSGFGRNCRPASPLKCAVTKRGACNSFGMRSYKKTGGRGRLSLTRILGL